MTLEVLFAEQGQAACFLQMVLCGFTGAALLSLGGLWAKRRCLQCLWDVLLVAVMTLAVAVVLLQGGEGLRLYALLGLLLGAALYEAGIHPLLRRVAGLLKKSCVTSRRKAGIVQRHEE